MVQLLGWEYPQAMAMGLRVDGRGKVHSLSWGKTKEIPAEAVAAAGTEKSKNITQTHPVPSIQEPVFHWNTSTGETPTDTPSVCSGIHPGQQQFNLQLAQGGKKHIQGV